NIRNEVWHFENEIPCIRFLHGAAVQSQFNVEPICITQCVACHQVRAHRYEGVERLRPQPLTIGELQVARGDIIDDGVAGNIIERTADRNLSSTAADDNAQLGFVVHLPAHRRYDDRVVGAGDRIGIHSEEKRLFWHLAVDLFDMIFVVQTDADDFLRTLNWRVKSDIRRLEQERLNTARRSLQLLELFLEERQTVFDMQRFLNGKGDTRKF